MNDNSVPKILVVDDEPLNVELMEVYLSGDYEVIPAYGGAEGLEKVRTEDLDLVLLDVMMPGISGFDVCRTLKEDPLYQFIPVVMVTALSGKDDKIKSIEAGADDFLSKPVDRLELETRVKSLIKIRQLHTSLLAQRDQAQNYLDVAGVILLVLDKDQNVTLINRKGCEVLGRSEEGILGKNWFDSFLQPEKAEYPKKVFSRLLEGGIDELEYFENPILTADGEERLISWHNSILTDKKGNVTGVLSSGEDITERTKTEAALKDYAKQLEHSNELKDLFIDIIRHDLMNPAGAVKGFTDLLLKRGKLEDGDLRMLQAIKRTNTKLITMIESAATFAKIESVSEVKLKRMDLGGILNNVAQTLGPQLKGNRIKLNMSIEGPYPALVDPMIEQVFVNLLSNAIKYSPQNTCVSVEMEDLGREWRVKVIDQGFGILDEDKELVFERFKRMDKGNIKGTGLGLAIVRRIVDLHEGKVGVADNPNGNGSIFWVTLKKP
ncbi:PAS fold-containing protein [Methanococcoides vulcani]|uniref:histidine kinase n=1 Tax=Methanococcoides vulcani TaxID=1353158 RepID=A0A1H9ZCH5_9EURY|nr:response regulator [Methanococcoides vulcani]SES78527.1 PAS fold-containing protein [Methanococcoides vulcani]